MPAIWNTVCSIYLPVKVEQTQCSETLVFKLQTPVNHPEESIRHSKHGGSLKTRVVEVFIWHVTITGQFLLKLCIHNEVSQSHMFITFYKLSGNILMMWKCRRVNFHERRSIVWIICSHASLNDGDTFWEMRRSAISSLCERHIVYLHKPREYRYASLNDGDTFWEMRRSAISSLCERHIVYLHKPREYRYPSLNDGDTFWEMRR
jgi:hypothetical protein